MTRRINARTGVQQLSSKYLRVVLPADTWVAVAVPEKVDVMEALSSTIVVVRAAKSAVLPAAAPAGEGSLLPETFELAQGTTHLHLYGLEGAADVVFINAYTG